MSSRSRGRRTCARDSRDWPASCATNWGATRSGDLFLFVNRTRHRAKVLLWDGTGLCLYCNQPASHYISFAARRVPWLPSCDVLRAALSARRSQRLQCFVGWTAGSS